MTHILVEGGGFAGTRTAGSNAPDARKTTPRAAMLNASAHRRRADPECRVAGPTRYRKGGPADPQVLPRLAIGRQPARRQARRRMLLAAYQYARRLARGGQLLRRPERHLNHEGDSGRGEAKQVLSGVVACHRRDTGVHIREVAGQLLPGTKMVCSPLAKKVWGPPEPGAMVQLSISSLM